MDKNSQAFFALLKAGLWEQSVCLIPYTPLDFDALFNLADDQSVVGLIAAGLEHIADMKVTKQQAVPFLKKVYSLEGRNAAMNRFIEDLISGMRKDGVYALLIKGQSVAQCYERPQWRSSGDIDLLLTRDNYQKAKVSLIPKASSIDKEFEDRMHLGMTINSWCVELHGSLKSPRLGRVNKCIDYVQDDTFNNSHVRIWRNGETDVPLPAVDNDVIFVFTHILQHFFAGGIGLRQICDWCRLLWTFRDEIDRELLKSRLKGVRIMSEWEVFASLAVNYLGMPMEGMPFYQESTSLDRKASRLLKHILRTGNFGHNRDMSYLTESPFLIRKFISFWRVTLDVFSRVFIFPWDSIEFYLRYILSGSKSVLKGK